MKYAAIALLGAASARTSFGGCQPHTLQADFDSAAFAGNWYEQMREYSFMYEMGQECSTQSFKLNADGDLDIYFRAKFMLGIYNGVDGYLQCQNGSSTTHTCMASMAGSDPEYEFNFLATDYDNYAVSYFCMPMMGDTMKVEWFNILSRSQTLSEDLMTEAKSKITDQFTDFTLNWFTTHTTE